MSRPWVLFTITKMLDRASTFGAQLYDASFVDSTDDFNADISEIIDYQIANSNISFSDLGVYIQDTFGFKSAGQAKDIGGDTVEIQISDENTGQLDTLKVSVVPASQNIQGVTLTNEEGTATFVVTDPVTVSAVPVSFFFPGSATTMHNSSRPCSVPPVDSQSLPSKQSVSVQLTPKWPSTVINLNATHRRFLWKSSMRVLIFVYPI